MSLPQKEAKQTKVGCGTQTIVIYSIELVGNKLPKGWENWLPMPSRISTESEAVFSNSLKYKEPDFSSHLRKWWSINYCLLIFLKTRLSSKMQTSLQKVSVYHNLWHSESIKNLFFKYVYFSLVRGISVLRVFPELLPSHRLEYFWSIGFTSLTAL